MKFELLSLVAALATVACSTPVGTSTQSVCDIYGAGVEAFAEPTSVRLRGCYSEYRAAGETYRFISAGCGVGQICSISIRGQTRLSERYVRLDTPSQYSPGSMIEVEGEVVVRASPIYDGPVYAFVLTEYDD